MKENILRKFLTRVFIFLLGFACLALTQAQEDGGLDIPIPIDTSNLDINTQLGIVQGGFESENNSYEGQSSSSTTPSPSSSSSSSPRPVSSSRAIGLPVDTNNNKLQSLEVKMSRAPVDSVAGNVTKMLDELLNGYDKRLRPDFNGPPLQVNVDVLVKNVASIVEKDMEFKLDFYLRQKWRDPRLAFDLSSGAGSEVAEKIKYIVLTSEFINKIFIPDTFFRNEKNSFVHSTTIPNRFVKLMADGTIMMSTRLTVTASCNMDLTYYPMDKQVCGLNLGSYSYSTDSIQYNWDGCDSGTEGDHSCFSSAIAIDIQSLTLPQFRIEGYKCSHTMVITTTGNYSALSFEFLFARYLNYYITKNYIPAIIVVMVSYFALWFGRDSSYLLSYARMGIGITSVLTITTIYMSSNSHLNSVNYVKALDVYLILCFIGVFSTLFTSFVMLYASIVFKKKEKKIDKDKEKEKKKKEKEEAKKKKLEEKQKEMEKEENEKQKGQITTTNNKLDNNGLEINEKDFIINMKNLEESKIHKADEEIGAESKKKVDKKGDDKDEDEEDDEKDKEHIVKAQLWVSKLDRSCRIAYPILFAVLNIIYWSSYLTASSRSYSDSKWAKL